MVGVPPLGCEPLIRTIRDDETKCDDDLNKVAFSFNLKIKRELQVLKRLFGIKVSYIDIYSIILEAVQNPHKFGKKTMVTDFLLEVIKINSPVQSARHFNLTHFRPLKFELNLAQVVVVVVWILTHPGNFYVGQ